MTCVALKVSETIDSLVHKLKDEGFRITDQRRALIEFLVKTDKALSIPQIYSGLLDLGIQVDEASVYRSIKVLKDIKIVHELSHGLISLCQHSSCGSEHLHMSWLCDSCGETMEPKMQSKELKDLQKMLGFKRNKISHVRINYLCDSCQN